MRKPRSPLGRGLAAIIGYSLLLAAVFYPVVFGGMVPATPDSVVPGVLSQALGRLATQPVALWQPWTFSGMPTLEAFSGLSGLYYPNALFSFLGLEGILLQFLHLVFAALGMYLFLRALRLGTLASFFGGAAFMLNPSLVVMLVHGHGSQLMTASYMPWMLLASFRLMQDGGLFWTGFLALVAGFQLQRSHVQVAWYSWLMTAILVAFTLFRGQVPPVRRLGRLFLVLVALALGVAMAAAIYLPAAGYAPFSVRGMAGSGGGAAWEYATLWSMHPLELLTYVVPGLYGFGGASYWGFMPFTDYPHYAGIVVLMLAFAGLLFRGRTPGRLFAAAILALAVLLSFGSFFPPVYSLFYHAAPLFSRFRVPSMALLMASVALVVLAARGLDCLREADLTSRSRLLGVAMGSLALPLAAFLLFSDRVEELFRSLLPPPASAGMAFSWMLERLRWESFASSVLFSMALLLVVLLLLRMLEKQLLGSTLAAVCIAVAALMDLGWVDLRIVDPPPSSLRSSPLMRKEALDEAFSHDEVTRYLAEEGAGMRVYPAGRLFGENKFALFGIESAGGYHPAKLAVYEELLRRTDNLANLNALRLLSVGHLLSVQPVEHPALDFAMRGRLVLPSGVADVFVYRLVDPLPRAWFARRVVALEDRQAVHEAAFLGEVQPGVAFVDASSGIGNRDFAPGEVLGMERSAEHLQITVAAPSEAFLVVSEVYYPERWLGAVDGHPATVVEVDGVVRGVVVPEGRHEVTFTYERRVFDMGSRIAMAAFLVALSLFCIGGIGWFRKGRGDIGGE